MMEIDYNNRLLRYSLTQFRNMSGYKEFLSATADLFHSLQQGTLWLLDWTYVDTASGKLLDYLGYLFGTSRGFFDISQYFCTNASDINAEKYFYFDDAQLSAVVPLGSLSDKEFRQRIKARIYQLYSNGTRNDLIKVIRFMTFSNAVKIEKISAMNLEVELSGEHIFYTNKTFLEIENILPVGVCLNKLTINGVINHGK